MKIQKPKIVVDQDIPFLRGVLEPYAQVVYQKGSAIDAQQVRDAKALLVRTRTSCDRSLLEGSSVTFVGSATIGADHIDQEALSQLGIAFANVPGCNSGGVMQYVFTALYGLVARGTDVLPGDPKGRWAAGRTLGVIGVGHVGSRVVQVAKALGFQVLACDPPRQAVESAAGSQPSTFVDLDTVLAASDVVTLHVPLDATTRGMVGKDFLDKMKRGAILINTSRGPVIEQEPVLAARQSGHLGGLVLDVWPQEPALDPALLAACDWASPHIAGYSWEGKINGTNGVVRALAAHQGWDSLLEFDARQVVPAAERRYAPSWDLSQLAHADNATLAEHFESVFDLPGISHRLKQSPELFEEFRSKFDFRPEFLF